MRQFVIPLFVSIILFCSTALSYAEVKIQQATDGSITVTTPIYTANIDAQGNLLGVVVQGAKSLAHKFGTPNEKLDGVPSVHVINQLVAVRLGEKRVEWTFLEDTIHVVTQGYSFECQLDPSVKTVVVPNGQGGPATGMYANSTAIVLANDLTIAYSFLFHAGTLRMVPTCYLNGSGINFGDKLEFDLKIGAPVAAVQLLSRIEINGVGNSYGNLLDDGNQGNGIVHFTDPTKIAFHSTQASQAKEQFQLEYTLAILNHKVAGKEVARQTQAVSMDAGGKVELNWNIPKLAPGFYYLTVAVWKDGTKFSDSKLTFVVDLANYTHALTRPADFKTFWEKQNTLLHDSQINPVLTQVSEKTNPNKAYDVKLNMPDGSIIHGVLIIPEKIGKSPSQFGSLLDAPLDALIESTKQPDFNLQKPDVKTGELTKIQNYVSLTVNLPQDGTYTQWKDATDNNLLQCILTWLRCIDYLVTRPEVNPKRIMVSGASRTGGLTIIAAALRPENVCAANGFVHTSCGISWEDELYQGWGKCPDPNNPESIKLFCQQAAYVDPVNFAPDVKCPTIMAYGIDDDLAPPWGIEALYHLLGARWKRISRDNGGHQYSAGCQKIQNEMLSYLNADATQSPDQTRTLNDH